MPFGLPVDEVPLAHSPLITVLAQIRFPPVASIAREDFIGPFQERIRARYPVLRQEREVSVVVTAQGAHAGTDTAPLWHFLDGETPEWTVSLASSFVALGVSRYTSRSDFLSRLRDVLVALAETVRPSMCDRIGVRYVDRVPLDPAFDLDAFVRPEVVGVTTLDPEPEATLVHSISDTEFHLADSVLHGRWGRVPANALLDPVHGPSIDAPSWIFDLDMYAVKVGAFEVDALTSYAELFAERIYRFFRWAVRPAFLQHFGGAV